MAEAEAIVGELADLIGIVRTLAASVARLEARLEAAGLFATPDREADLLEAIAEAGGSGGMTGRELVEFASALEGPALQNALTALLGDDWRNPRRVGKLFARIADQPFGGLVLCRIGSEAGSGIWSVRPAS